MSWDGELKTDAHVSGIDNTGLLTINAKKLLFRRYVLLLLLLLPSLPLLLLLLPLLPLLSAGALSFRSSGVLQSGCLFLHFRLDPVVVFLR